MAEDSILGFLQNNEVISDSQGFAANVGIDHNELENVIKSLRGFEIIDAQEFQKDRWFLKEEGKNYVREGTPEVQLFEAVPPEGISREDLQKKLNPTVFKIGSSWAVKKKWVEIGRQGVSRKVVDEKDLIELKSRKLIEFKPLKGYSLRKVPSMFQRGRRLQQI
ncbi:hypothetical protein HPP92_002580 [Vanilla planifolia]|uniref:PheRS DNA binding domain-containing protein n=1 Tax=Vanilla planifolia TaxID=51239 RepID=A0A835VEM9_VANPL|nr:hypothetical protein HPP92_002580 [Vanilla planifolia]